MMVCFVYIQLLYRLAEGVWSDGGWQGRHQGEADGTVLRRDRAGTHSDRGGAHTQAGLQHRQERLQVWFQG